MRSPVLVAVVLLAASARAAEPTLELARSQLKELQYAEASRTLARLAGAEDFVRAQALEFFTLDGLIKGALNDGPGATKAFTRALLIDPGLTLPGRPSPRVSTPFLEAKGWVREHGALGLTPAPAQREADRWVLVFDAPPDEAGLIETLVFFCVEDGVAREVTLTAEDPLKLELKGHQVQVRWQLRGAHRWLLNEGGPVSLEAPAPAPVVARPAVLAPRPVTVANRSEPRGFSKIPGIVLLAVGVAAVGVSAIFFAGADSNERSLLEATTHSNFQYYLYAGKGDQTAAWLLLGGGSAVAAAGVVLLVVSLTAAPPKTTVSFVPTAAGGLAVLSGTF